MTKLELKAKRFAPKYIANNMNGTKTVEELQPEMSHHVAKSRATEMLSNPVYQREIVNVMEEKGLDDTVVTESHKRNLIQAHSYSASNQAIDIYHKVKGNYAPERHESVSLHLSGKELVDAIKALQSELTDL